MKAINAKQIGIFLILTLFSVFTIVPAQSPKDDIKNRMKGRFIKINELKKNGIIGENPQGLLEAIKPKDTEDLSLSAIITAENEDRKVLYGLIGKESETSAEEVGMANAKRIFQKATDAEYFKSADGEWKKKKDMTVEKP